LDLFVAIALFFLCLTTILAYYYIAETNTLFDKKFEITIYTHLLKMVMMLVIMYGSINQAKLAWDIGDLG
jgi:AGCS family alanine or glycine:cation symporter